MRHRIDEEPMTIDRRIERDHLEQVRAGAGKDRERLARSVVFAVEVLLDPFDVRVEAFALRGLAGNGLGPLAEHLANELPIVFTAVLVRDVEIEADHRKRAGFERGQSFHSLTQRLHG